MPKTATGEQKWTPIPGGIGTEYALREKPGAGHAPVTTRATAAIISYGDGWMRWAVTFHAYTPKKPLEMRTKTNRTMGTEVEIPPPPSIPKRVVQGVIPYEENGVETARQEAKKRCEETVEKGRPRQ